MFRSTVFAADPHADVKRRQTSKRKTQKLNIKGLQVG